MAKTEYSLRSLNCELNNLSNPDGSSILMQGETSVIASVYGPTEAKYQNMLHNKAHIQTCFEPITGPPSVDGRLMELYLKDTCESAILTSLHPASTISINVKEAQNCGGLLACAINASCLALINASVSMKYTFAAVCCMIDKQSQDIIIDPNKMELQNAKAVFTCVFDSSQKELICCQTSGRFSDKELLESVAKCKEASQYIFDFYRDIVQKYATAI